MLSKRLVVITVMVVAASGIAMAGYHSMRPRTLCSIPHHDYQWGSRSRSEMRLSTIGQLIQRDMPRPQQVAPDTPESLPPPQAQGLSWIRPASRLEPWQKPDPHRGPVRVAEDPQIKVFQLDRPSLQIDHCSISRVALQLHKNGLWALSLRGDQNPEGASQVIETPAGSRQTGHLKRNKFVIKIRCFGQYRVDEEQSDTSTGKPVLLQLRPIEFWVQRAEPKDFFRRGHHPDATALFDLIDRAEIEFFYE